ncbi:MAG: hypothetical protein AAF549_08180 [Pseudomonadota bacterium]
MARIFVSFFSPLGSEKILSYYEGFLNSLADQGNDVLYSVSNDILSRPWDDDSQTILGFDKKRFTTALENFKPDVAFIFNNSGVKDLHEIIDCPIAIMEADLALYYSNKTTLKNNNDKYNYFYTSEKNREMIKDLFSVDDKYIFKINHATAVNSEFLEKTNNISFIGSAFIVPNEIRNKIKRFKSTDIDLFFTKLKNNPNLLDGVPISYKEYLNIKSSQDRMYVLQSICDLGLNLYGKGWDDLENTPIDLCKIFEKKDTYTLKQNQDIYNKSKISINISHAQAADTFPWRVTDILASSSCLITQNNQGVKDFLKGYIDIPMYDNIYEVRELCKKVLKDEGWKKEIIDICNKAIHEKGRWIYNFEKFEEIFDISFVNNKKGSIKKLESTQFTNEKHLIYLTATKASKIIPKPLHIHCYNFLKFMNINFNYDLAKKIQNQDI